MTWWVKILSSIHCDLIISLISDVTRQISQMCLFWIYAVYYADFRLLRGYFTLFFMHFTDSSHYLVPFAHLKNVKNTHGGVLLAFSKVGRSWNMPHVCVFFVFKQWICCSFWIRKLVTFCGRHTCLTANTFWKFSIFQKSGGYKMKFIICKTPALFLFRSVFRGDAGLKCGKSHSTH